MSIGGSVLVSVKAEKILQTLQDENATKKRIETALDLEKKHHTIDAMGEISSGFTCFTR